MKKLDMHTPDLTALNIAKLAELFPNCITEASDVNGRLKKIIDFDQLRQELSHSIIEGPQERYQLNWPGKREALLTANAPIAKTLRPCREESLEFGITKNLFIEGDNLDALKLLQETYLNKVKMIYIDPPYNTGNDFLYTDDFSENTDDFLKRSNQKDEEGNRLVANTESNGRFHSDWLSMMYPRLKLARNLLREDGIIFISIDDGEVANLRTICDEIFGRDNFLANIVWQKKYAATNDSKGFSNLHDHVIVYQKSKSFERFLLPRTDEMNKPYKNDDGDGRGLWRSDNLLVRSFSQSGVYPIINANTGEEFIPPEGSCWRASKSTMSTWLKENRIYFGKDGKGAPQLKRYLTEVQQGRIPTTWWTFEEVGHNDAANKELKELFNMKAPFDTPKPSSLIRQMLRISTAKQDLILDFFSGSATTAHAVMQLNAEDGGNRKFIMVQLPELCNEKSDAFKAGYRTIAEIGKERIRRAGKKIKAEHADKADIKQLDIGFRVLKVDSSNMKEVYYTPDAVQQSDLINLVDNVRADRTAEDLLFQTLLDCGIDLSLPICEESVAGKTIFFVDGTVLAACFDLGINEALVKQLAARQPERMVFRDAGFESDSMRINVEQIFKLLSPSTDIKIL